MIDEELQEKVVDTATTEQDEGQVQAEEQLPTAKEVQAKTFTQEQVNEFVKQRIEKERNSVFKRYGVTNKTELDNLMGKAHSYDVMYERLNKMRNDYNTLNQEYAFNCANINTDKTEDVLAYFKGKGIALNKETLLNEVATHPEWLRVKEVSDKPVTTIERISPQRSEVVMENEKDKVAKMFNLHKII